MKFAHLGDCHLGGWRHPELKELNFQSFKFAIDKCIREKVDFILIAGDLFDSPYPPIDILKETFSEFRKLKEAGVPVFIVAGSHDYSVSGKTFLEVLEKSGFCKNVFLYEERGENIILEPTLFKNVAIYGYPGKKSSLEVEDIEKIKLQDAPGLFKILMLHTAIRDAVGTLPIKAVNEKELPKVDYLALGHLHIHYQKENRVYSGPIFPNTLSELEELKGGSFQIFDNGRVRREDIVIKPVSSFSIEITNALEATEKTLNLLEKENVRDRIVILRLYGVLEQGKVSDIDFSKIESFLKSRGAYVFLKSTARLFFPEPDLNVDIMGSSHIEAEIIKSFEKTNPSRFNYLIPEIMKSLQAEKKEDEKSSVFEERLLSEAGKILKI